MFLKYIFGLCLLCFNSINSFNLINLKKNHINLFKLNDLMKSNNMMKSNDMINYLTSIKDYTIITIGDENRHIEEIMNKNNMKVYYVNLDNILDKNEIIEILQKKYKNLNSGEYLWIFYRGFFMGTTEDIYKMIKNKLN